MTETRIDDVDPGHFFEHENAEWMKLPSGVTLNGEFVNAICYCAWDAELGHFKLHNDRIGEMKFFAERTIVKKT